MNATNPVALASLDGRRLAALGATILALHRDAIDLEPELFLEWTLERLRENVRFDSCMWGHGHADPVVFHDVQVLGQPPEMMANYAKHQRDDFFAAGCAKRPGEAVDLYDVIDRDAFVRRPIYRRHAKRFGMEHILCVYLPEPDRGFASFASLWRARYDDPYGPADRMTFQVLMPHLVEARRRHALEHLRRAVVPERPATRAAAVCDRKGTLHECDDGFVAMLRSAFAGWQGPELPATLAAAVGRSARGWLDTPTHRVQWRPFEQRVFLRARPLHPFDSLPPKLRQVAVLLVEGRTQKEAARRLGVSPSTVRTHAFLLYRRLGVTNRAQLAQCLAGAERDEPAMRRAMPEPRSTP